MQRRTDSVVVVPLMEPNIPRLSPSPIDRLNDMLRTSADKNGVDVAFVFNDVIKARNALVSLPWLHSPPSAHGDLERW